MLVICIGNRYRSDDSVGLVVAELLRSVPLPDCEIITTSGEGISLINLWEGYEQVMLIDAISSEAEPGTIHRLDAINEPIDPAWFKASTHLFSIPEAVLLAKQVNRLPQSLMIYGIEGGNFDYGETLSGKVVEAVGELVALITKRIKNAVLT